MQKSPSKAPERSFGVQVVLLIVFKYKWMIFILTLLGLGAGAAVYVKQKPLYQSEAKLLVRHVKGTGSVDTHDRMKGPDGGRRSDDPVIINEMEMLSSVDLATEVASAIGIEKLLPDSQGPVSPSDAARVISSNLLVDFDKGSSVLRVNYKHGNPELSKRVLRELVERYFTKHLDIRLPGELIQGLPNITMVQQPTEPVKVPDEFSTKLVLGLAAGGLALGLGIAFLRELVFNRKIERPATNYR